MLQLCATVKVDQIVSNLEAGSMNPMLEDAMVDERSLKIQVAAAGTRNGARQSKNVDIYVCKRSSCRSSRSDSVRLLFHIGVKCGLVVPCVV